MFLNEDGHKLSRLNATITKLFIDNIERVEVFEDKVWEPLDLRELNVDHIYRIPHLQDFVDWDIFGPGWDYVRRNKDGSTYLFDSEPQLNHSEDGWVALGSNGSVLCGDRVIRIDHLLIHGFYKNNGAPWNWSMPNRL